MIPGPETPAGCVSVAELHELDRQRREVTSALRDILADADWEAWPGQCWPMFYSPVEPCESCGSIVVAADNPLGWNAGPVQVWELGDFPPASGQRFVLDGYVRLHTPYRCKEARKSHDQQH